MKLMAGKLARRPGVQGSNRRLAAMLVAAMALLVAISFIIVLVRN